MRVCAHQQHNTKTQSTHTHTLDENDAGGGVDVGGGGLPASDNDAGLGGEQGGFVGGGGWFDGDGV